MIGVVHSVLVAVLLWSVVKARSRGEALALVMACGLLTLPLVLVGNSANAAVFAIDVALLLFVLRFARSLNAGSQHAPGVWALKWLAGLCVVCSLVYALLIDAGPWRFYVFTTVKFLEYLLIAVVMSKVSLDSREVQRVARILIFAVCAYQVTHLLHLFDLLPLSGAEYFGVRATELGDEVFENRQSWFLAAIKASVAGIGSINMWLMIALSSVVQGRLRRLALIGAIMAGVCVLGTTSRSDIAGIATGVGAFVVLLKGTRRVRWLVGTGFAAVASVATMLAVWNGSGDEASLVRLQELVDSNARNKGSYADRSSDRVTLPAHLMESPERMMLGSGPGYFRRYRNEGVTINAMGHNSYLHWLGELGIGGVSGVLAWCAVTIVYFARQSLIARATSTPATVAPVAVALIVGRAVAAWGAESLFGTDGMGYYSMYMVAAVYLLFVMARGGSASPVGMAAMIASGAVTRGKVAGERT